MVLSRSARPYSILLARGEPKTAHSGRPRPDSSPQRRWLVAVPANSPSKSSFVAVFLFVSGEGFVEERGFDADFSLGDA
ncbi:MAG: hypothetical protein AAB951_00940, partial [Patescibacteria group bacterium]